MERVNLLPEEARLRPLERLLLVVDRQFPKVLLGAVGSVAAVGLLITLIQGFSLFHGRQRLKALKQEIQLLQVENQNKEGYFKQLDQIQQELQRQKALIDQKVAYLAAARAHPRLWATVLKDLRRNIPHGVWLTELETGPDGSLRVAGGATDENLVTEFMTTLKTSPHFSDVGFTYTEKDAIGQTRVVKFEIVCRVG